MFAPESHATLASKTFSPSAMVGCDSDLEPLLLRRSRVESDTREQRHGAHARRLAVQQLETDLGPQSKPVAELDIEVR